MTPGVQPAGTTGNHFDPVALPGSSNGRAKAVHHAGDGHVTYHCADVVELAEHRSDMGVVRPLSQVDDGHCIICDDDDVHHQRGTRFSPMSQDAEAELAGDIEDVVDTLVRTGVWMPRRTCGALDVTGHTSGTMACSAVTAEPSSCRMPESSGTRRERLRAGRTGTVTGRDESEESIDGRHDFHCPGRKRSRASLVYVLVQWPASPSRSGEDVSAGTGALCVNRSGNQPQKEHPVSTTTTLDPEQAGHWKIVTDTAEYILDLTPGHRRVRSFHAYGKKWRDLRFFIRCVVGEPMALVVHDEEPDRSTSRLQCTAPVRSICSA